VTALAVNVKSFVPTFHKSPLLDDHTNVLASAVFTEVNAKYKLEPAASHGVPTGTSMAKSRVSVPNMPAAGRTAVHVGTTVASGSPNGGVPVMLVMRSAEYATPDPDPPPAM